MKRVVDDETATALRALLEETVAGSMRTLGGPKIPPSRVRAAIRAMEAAGWVMPGPKIRTTPSRPRPFRGARR